MSKHKKSVITIRIDEDIAKAFKDIAERERYTQTHIITEFIKHYVKKNGQGDLFK